MLQGFVSELVDKYVLPYATVDEKELSVGIRDGRVCWILHAFLIIYPIESLSC